MISKNILFRITRGLLTLTLVTAGFTSPLLAVDTTLVDEDFQTPLLANGTASPAFTGWALTDGNNVISRTSASTSDIPGDQATNQAVQFQYTSAKITYDTTHGWVAGKAYTLTLNASPQSWSGTTDRYIAPRLLQTDGTELWAANEMMAKYDSFGRVDPWPTETSFTYIIASDDFTTGTAGQNLRLEIAHTGSRGIYVDNISLIEGDMPADTTPPTPDPLTWVSEPAVVDVFHSYMEVTTASDPFGVEYYFENSTAGTNSGWQSGTLWSETHLTPGNHTYRAKARDKHPNLNETAWSSEATITIADVPLTLVTTDFQTPLYPNGTTGTNGLTFLGWTLTPGTIAARADFRTDGFPGDPAIPNQALNLGNTSDTPIFDTTHTWAADDIYRLTLNASPQEWNGTSDRFIVPSILQQDNTLLWTSSEMMPKSDPAFEHNPWTAAQTFTYIIKAKDFSTGTPGQPLRLKIAHSGQRGIYLDNITLSRLPEGGVFSIR